MTREAKMEVIKYNPEIILKQKRWVRINVLWRKNNDRKRI